MIQYRGEPTEESVVGFQLAEVRPTSFTIRTEQ